MNKTFHFGFMSFIILIVLIFIMHVCHADYSGRSGRRYDAYFLDDNEYKYNDLILLKQISLFLNKMKDQVVVVKLQKR